MTKEDLIGTEWKCPWIKCKYKTKITKDGINHSDKGHSIIHTLKELFDMEMLLNKKFKYPQIDNNGREKIN